MNLRTQEIFHEVADLDDEKRARYFAEHGVNERTRQEVEALLVFDAAASKRLDQAISEAANWALPETEAVGRRCGPYRLLSAIGRGGMGAVYLAERVDGEVRQRVAVKFMAFGAGAPQVERFLQERQILAALAHPNIARMLDAGRLDNGQPFLVMEYVDGKPINEFAAALGIRQKIALFLKVCSAVSYSHRNLVVHRDIKPSNILVSTEGEPKLLDFGIAKMLDVARDAATTGMRMLTPDYASPEQALGGTISTATDIYSLGAVLYHLLTSRAPHEFEEHSPEAIRHGITAREVTRPSKWVPELKGDLEGILLTALRKDPAERYETVEQLAEDLEAFLKSRPVRARSGDAWYRTRTFVRRHWVPLTAGGLVVASLGIGLLAANRERALAQRRFKDVQQLSNRLFDIDAQVRQLPGSTKVRQLIVNTSLEYLARLRADAARDPALALDVAAAYASVAEVEGVGPGAGNLGQMDKAARDLKIAEDMVQSVLVSQPANRVALLRAAFIANDQRLNARFTYRFTDEVAWARKAVERLDKFHPGPGDESDAPRILLNYANAEASLADADSDEALRIGRRGSDLASMFHLPLQQATFLTVTAEVLRNRGDLEEALRAAHRGVVLREPTNAKSSLGRAMNYVYACRVEALILGEDDGLSLGRAVEAAQVFERAFNLTDSFVHQDANDEASRSIFMSVGLRLANIVRHRDPRRALSIYDHVLQHLAENKSTVTQVEEAYILSGSSYALRSLGRNVEARRRLDRAMARLKQFKLYPIEKIAPDPLAGEVVRVVLQALADHDAGTGDVSRGVEIYRGLLDGLAAGGIKPDTKLTDAAALSPLWASMAALQLRAGDVEGAAALEGRRVSLWRQWDRRLPNNPFIVRQLRAALSSMPNPSNGSGSPQPPDHL
jgi:serine/threonine-protein kinase